MRSDFEARRRLNDPVAALPFDLSLHLAVALRDACELQIPEIFTDLAVWAQTTLTFRGFPPSAVFQVIAGMRKNVVAYVPSNATEAARTILENVEKQLLRGSSAESPSIEENRLLDTRARRFFEAIFEGDESAASREVLFSVAEGRRIVDVYQQMLTPALHETGRLWQRNELSISKEHSMTAVTERVMAQLIELTPTRPHREFSVVSCAPENAQHQIGARMVADAFALAGWHSTYLGGNVPLEDLLAYLDDVSVDVLALSATLGRDLMPIRSLISELENRPLSPVVLVGGRAFALHPMLWRQIGADGYAVTPMTAVALAGELLSE